MILDSPNRKIQLRQVLGQKCLNRSRVRAISNCHFFSVSFPAEAVQLVPGLYFSARRRVGCRGTEKAHQSNNIEARSRAERNICHMYVFTW